MESIIHTRSQAANCAVYTSDCRLMMSVRLFSLTVSALRRTSPSSSWVVHSLSQMNWRLSSASLINNCRRPKNIGPLWSIIIIIIIIPNSSSRSSSHVAVAMESCSRCCGPTSGGSVTWAWAPRDLWRHRRLIQLSVDGWRHSDGYMSQRCRCTRTHRG